MCDQTEVEYTPGDVVWVKLGPVWWPGQVYDYDKLPEEITANLRKKPIAVVKFFQEETFEYVKNLNSIYQYNCRKKEEFIKKGLDLVRSSNSRDVPSNMKMFPNDIVMAEHLTGGDPNILSSDTFATEEKKSDYKELFGSSKKSSSKKAKLDSIKTEKGSWKTKRHSISSVKNERHSLPALSSTVPRPITHHRFIKKALEGRSDYEIRIMIQDSDKAYQAPPPPIVKDYDCYLCGYHTTRLNVMMIHQRSHSSNSVEDEKNMKARLKAKQKDKHTIAVKPSGEQTPTIVTSRGRVKSLPKKLMDYTDEPPPKIFKENIQQSIKKEDFSESPEKSPIKTPKKQKDYSERKPIKRPLFGKRKTAKEKAQLAEKVKQENEAMKETLLKDWDDDNNEEEVELDRLKQALESTTSTIDEDVDTSIDSNKTPDMVEKPQTKMKEKLNVYKSKSKEVTVDSSKTKVFEFDDTEDSLPVTINFRHKNKRQKFYTK